MCFCITRPSCLCLVFNVCSEITETENLLKQYASYEAFLFSISPKKWQDKQIEKKRKRREKKRGSMSYVSMLVNQKPKLHATTSVLSRQKLRKCCVISNICNLCLWNVRKLYQTSALYGCCIFCFLIALFSVRGELDETVAALFFIFIFCSCARAVPMVGSLWGLCQRPSYLWVAGIQATAVYKSNKLMHDFVFPY